ncbi:MAG: patatin-like phospholipase family protein [Lentimicrobium sp.]|nr:patatin-like phospholipase family protein [Lentimicrobium sp.]
MNNIKISLVLSSGGARGLAHIGAIDALIEHGYEITAIAGTSMGSLVGGVYACGKMEEFRSFMTELTRMDVIRLMDLAVSKTGIIKGEKVFNEMKNFLGNVRIEDLPIPYAAIAADLNHHREVVITKGNLLSAIRASSSIPSVLMPVSKDGKLLVDGGLVNPLPLEHVEIPKGNILVAVNVNAPRQENLVKQKDEEDSIVNKTRKLINDKWNSMTGGHPKRSSINGIFDIVHNSFELMQHKLTLYALEKQTPEILLNIPVNSADTFDFHKAECIIESGYKAMAKLLSEYEIKRKTELLAKEL